MKEQMYSYNEAELLILESRTKLISFDIFDTLITRPVLKPEDLFYFIERKASKSLGQEICDYETLRLDAERLAYTYAREFQNSEEAEYDVIYNKFQTLAGLSNDKVEKLKQLELETELEFIRPRKSGRELYDLAISTGKRVVLISDIYFKSDTLEKIVQANGYAGYERLDVSGDYSLRKSSGNLFRRLSEIYNIEHSKWLHIGDNPISDIKRPQELGISTIYLPSVASIFLKKNNFWHINLENFNTSTRIVLGMIANKYFDNPLTPMSKEKGNYSEADFLLDYLSKKLHCDNDVRFSLNLIIEHMPIELEKLISEYVAPSDFTDYLNIWE
jgi:predicted HAD superfamily hydrolase